MVERERQNWTDRLLFHSGEVVLCIAALFMVFTVARAVWSGSDMATRERKVVRALRAVHLAQADSLSSTGHFKFLSELPALTREPPLRELRAAAAGSPGTELFEAHDYYFALYLADPARADDRSWSRAQSGSTDVGTKGYGVFAWPKEYCEDTQWAFYVDHRGRLLASWNLNELLDGTKDPFPPAMHPLKDYMGSQKEGDDSEWVEYDTLDELTAPTPSSKPARN